MVCDKFQWGRVGVGMRDKGFGSSESVDIVVSKADLDSVVVDS